jgi:hypothetical protein
LEEQGGGFLARLFGVGTEEELAAFNQAVTQSFALVQELAATALDSISAGAVARLEQSASEFGSLAEDAEKQATDAAEQRATLQQNLFKADLSQRARIIAQIQAQKKAEADAAKAAEVLRDKERAAKTEAAQKQRQADIIQAGVNAGQAILQNFASTPFPLNFINAGLIAGLAALQIGAISSQPLPTFAQGGFTGAGSSGPDGTGHRVAGIVHANEYVAPAFVTRSPRAARALGELEGMRMRGFAEGGPTSPNTQITGGGLDADALISGFSQALQNMPVPVLDLRETAKGLRTVELAEARARL